MMMMMMMKVQLRVRRRCPRVLCQGKKHPPTLDDTLYGVQGVHSPNFETDTPQRRQLQVAKY
jgi:hypothetical protein